MFIMGLGALFFGLIVGWITYRILRRKAGAPWLADLIALGRVIGDAAVLAFFRSDVAFGWYAIGLVFRDTYSCRRMRTTGRMIVTFSMATQRIPCRCSGIKVAPLLLCHQSIGMV